MRLRRKPYVLWVVVVCFYVSIRLGEITIYTATLPESEAINCYDRRLRLPSHITALCPNSSGTCAQINCERLLAGPQIFDNTSSSTLPTTDYNHYYADYVAWRDAARPVHDLDLVTLTANCTKFRLSRGFDWHTSSIRDDVSDFPLAFNILAHRDANQLARLLRAIYRPHNLYCIHVDALSSDDFQLAVRCLAACFHNVRLASKLEPIVYAGFSRLQADITCMKDNLNSSLHWKYLINTAAQAFPLKTVEEMVQVLRLYNGANDIEGLHRSRLLRSRFRYEWHEDIEARKMVKSSIENPPPPHDIELVRGSAYGIFSREFVRFILEDRRVQDLLQWSRTTWSPDEFYWATLHHTYSNPHLHTPGAFSGEPSDKPWLAVYVNWFNRKMPSTQTHCHGQFVRGVCVFGVGDLPQLVQRREFFANKFYADSEPLALDCLEARLRHNERCPPEFDREFYSKLPFIIKPR